ncbi:MAG TPA: adenosine deaminase [Stellaceae bacterium]|nr:adenosine deaminase [Stellaceae bacterium]
MPSIFAAAVERAAFRGPRFGTVLFFFLAAASLASCAASGGPTSPGGTGNEQRIASYFEEIRGTPPLLGAFLRRMPKGGDLHNHLAGAIYAESYIAWAAADGLCVDKEALALVPPPCAQPQSIPAAQIQRDGALYPALINALSMRDFVAGPQSGHDHFFATFAKFSAAGERRGADMLAEAVERAGEENVSYVELMTSPGMGAARKIGAAVGWDEDLARLSGKMMAAGLGEIVPAVRRDLDEVEAGMRRRLGCAAAAARPGCAVSVRYLAQVIRVFPPEQVFAQALFAFELAKADPRVVGLNLVAPEDDPVTLRDYTRQMRLLGFLGRQMPAVRLALHAGELAPGLVPPEQLRFHIRQAVETAGARRIGHGVDVLEEDDPWGLLKEMAERAVMVEINLTSNDQILGIRGDRHPFATYRRFGVPMALSTDDEGVSRGDLTHEYLRAALTYRLGYLDLKALARNSLEYAFLPGESLWRSSAPFAPREACADSTPGAGEPAPACAAFLAASEKAQAQWRLEAAFAAFEALPWEQR